MIAYFNEVRNKFSEAPEHPKNSYAVVDGGHKETPEIAQEQIFNRLKSL